MSDKENVLILDRISDFNSVISFYEETAELITKLRPNITMTELKDEFESLSQYEKIVFAARAMVVSESLKLFNIEIKIRNSLQTAKYNGDIFCFEKYLTHDSCPLLKIRRKIPMLVTSI